MSTTSITGSSRTGATRLDSLQAARGVAALLVVLFHCGLAIFSHPNYWPTDPFNGLFAWGYQGVELFFALSGFVMVTAHRRDIGRPGTLGNYARKRFERIYPIYWVVLVGLLPIYAWRPDWGGGHATEPLVLLSSLVLVHLGTGAVVIAVSWTLFLEIVFYAVFASLLVGRRIGAAALAVWWAIALARTVLGPVGPLGLYPFDPVVLLFGFGMAAAALHNSNRVRRPGVVALAGCAVFVGNGLVSVYHPLVGPVALTLISGAAGATALLGLAGLERENRIRLPRTLLLLGNASYSIYLVHFPALSLGAKLLLPWAARDVPPLGVAVVLVAFAGGVGIAFHLLVERRLIRALARRRRPAPAAVASALDGGGRAIT